MSELRALRSPTAVSGRALAAAALALLLLGAALWHGALWHGFAVQRHSPAPAAHAANRSHGGLLSLPAAALAPVSRALGSELPAYRVGRAKEGFQAVSRPQRLRARFERSGVTLSSGELRLGMRLQAVGYGSSLRTLGGVMPRARANRVTYARPGLSEWYANGPSGIEQGFTLARAPAKHPSAPLTLSLALSGNTRASLAPGGDVLLSRAGAPSLRYGGLSVNDAGGRQLRSWFSLSGATVLLHVDSGGARYPLAIDPLVQQDEQPLPGEETGEGRFGLSVALSADGDTALIGGPGDNGFAGAAWVFTRSGSIWSQQGPKLTVSEPGEEAEAAQCVDEANECGFGRSVALSADGDTALIGGPRESDFRGAAWIFTRSGSTWSQEGEKLTGGAEEIGAGRFGRSVALSADGDTALIGGSAERSGHGAAWVFSRSGSAFAQPGLKLTGSDEVGEGYFGRSVALSSDGSTALIGGPGDSGRAGAAWTFARAGGEWVAQGPKLTAGTEESGEGRFGYSVALNAGGGTALIGARGDAENVGAAWVFTRSGSDWTQQDSKLTGQGEVGASQFGYSAALSASGDTALIGGVRDNEALGAAWAFTRSGNDWTQPGEKLTDEVERGPSTFGTSVALAANGGSALVGGPRATGKLGAVAEFLGDPEPAPHVTAVAPTSGPATGGTPVTITGSGFLAGATVQIGSAATSVTVVSDTEITAVTRATPAGSDEVVVTDLDGVSSDGPSYTYLEPETLPAKDEPTTGGEPLTTAAGSSGVLASIATVLAPPKLAVSGNLTPVSGVVRVKLPGSDKFTLLSTTRQIPFGSIVDATRGKVAVTTARAGGGTQVVTFYAGQFKLTQHRDALVVSILVGGNYSVCPTARQRRHLAHRSSAHASRKHSVRKLWAEGHGHYSTKGNYATGAVLGTRWLTEDLCEGTLIRVATDRVAVTNLVTHRRVTVTAGHSYLAKAP